MSVGGPMKDDNERKPEPNSGVTRRDFMKLSAVGVAVPALLGPGVVEAAGEEVAIQGPGKVPITLNVNGKRLSAATRAPRYPARRAARKLRPDRRQARLRSRSLWRLHRAAGRQAGLRLRGSGDRCPGQEHHHHRIPRRRRCAQPGDAGVRRPRRAAMRLLHSRLHRHHHPLSCNRIRILLRKKFATA